MDVLDQNQIRWRIATHECQTLSIGRPLVGIYPQRCVIRELVPASALERLQPITELGVDLNCVPHVLRTPRFMWRSAARDNLKYA